MLNPSKRKDEPSTQLKRRLRAPLFSLSAYDLHKRLVNNYLLSQKGSTAVLQRDTSRDKRDIDVIRENHRFLWNTDDAADSWEQQLAKKYYDKLFKEYCICDLTYFKQNKVAMRWRIEEEVVTGKGQFQCGDKSCVEKDGLRTWEVNFAYVEHGVKNNALVKLRLCENCSSKLNYHHTKREVKRTKKDGTKRKKRKHSEDATEEASEETAGPSKEADAEVAEQEDDTAAWKARQSTDEKSRDEEFQDYLEELLL